MLALLSTGAATTDARRAARQARVKSMLALAVSVMVLGDGNC